MSRRAPALLLRPLQRARPRATPPPRLPRVRARAHSTVDQREISHFDGLAATWWDPRGASRLLHLMNPLRVRFVQSCLRESHPRSFSASLDSPEGGAVAGGVLGGVLGGGGEKGGEKEGEEGAGGGGNTRGGGGGLRFMDVGCGGGILAEALARLPGTLSVLGVDPGQAVLEVAREHARCDPALGGRLRYVNTTVDRVGEALGWASEGGGLPQFDVVRVVTSMEVLEHVPHPRSFLRSCMSHVAPGGWLLLSTIARTPLSWVTTKLVAEDLLRIVPRGTHDWSKYVNADELRTFFQAQPGWGEGEGAVKVVGTVYVPGLGWREVPGGERLGNYFFGVRRRGGGTER